MSSGDVVYHGDALVTIETGGDMPTYAGVLQELHGGGRVLEYDRLTADEVRLLRAVVRQRPTRPFHQDDLVVALVREVLRLRARR